MLLACTLAGRLREDWGQPAYGLNGDDWDNVECVTRTTWSSSPPGVLDRLLAVGGLGEQHPQAGLSTQRAQHRQRRRRLALLRPNKTAGGPWSGARRRGLQAAPEEVREP